LPRTFDADGRITTISMGGVDGMAFGYDAANRITGINETGIANKTYGYDALDRLTGYAEGAATTAYTYDADAKEFNGHQDLPPNVTPLEMSRLILPDSLEEALQLVAKATFVANPQAKALDRGQSELTWAGSGTLYLDDMDHSEKKDLIVLIDGILLATGLAMLAELLCKFAERRAREGD
jgi:YD repeat-containing protein